MEAFFIGVFLTVIWVILGIGAWRLIEKSSKYDTESGAAFLIMVWPFILFIEAFS